MPENGSDPASVAVAAGLGEVEGTLKALLAQSRTDLIDLAVADTQHRQMVLNQFPTVGSKRVIVYRTGNGFDGLSVPTTGVLVLSANSARLGSTFVNSGSNAIILYLGPAKAPGIPAVWLAASGGSWDGRFGNLPWCGNVFAVAQSNSSTLVGGEL